MSINELQAAIEQLTGEDRNRFWRWAREHFADEEQSSQIDDESLTQAAEQLFLELDAREAANERV